MRPLAAAAERPAAHIDQSTLEHLDATCDRADELNARVAAPLEQMA